MGHRAGSFYCRRRVDAPPARGLPRESLIEAHRNVLLYVAWFEYGFMAAYKDTMNDLCVKKPQWLSRDIDGNEVATNGFAWLNPLHPKARKSLLELVLEAVDKYDLDGVQFDDHVVWSRVTMGDDDYTQNVYAAKREERRPGLLVSLSPSIHPWVSRDNRDLSLWLRNLNDSNVQVSSQPIGITGARFECLIAARADANGRAGRLRRGRVLAKRAGQCRRLVNDACQADAFYQAAKYGYVGFVSAIEVEFDVQASTIDSLLVALKAARGRERADPKNGSKRTTANTVRSDPVAPFEAVIHDNLLGNDLWLHVCQ